MGYELDCNIVDARILGERAVRELGKLLVIAAREIRPDLPYLLLDDVGVVEQPLSRRTDVDATLRSLCESVMNFVEYTPRIVEPE